MGVKYALVAVFLLTFGSSLRAADHPKIEAVLELPPWDDFFTLDAAGVVNRCTQIIGEKPDSSSAQLAKLHRIRGRAHVKLGKNAEAKEDFDRVLELTPDDHEVRVWRAMVLVSLGQEKEALAECEKVLRSDPECVLAHVAIGAVYLGQQDVDPCIRHASKAIALSKSSDRNRALAYSLRAQAHFELGNYSRCVDDLTNAMVIYPVKAGFEAPGRAYLLRACAFKNMGEWELAVANLQMARKLAPESFDVVLELWQVQYRMGHYYVCQELVEQLFALGANNPQTHLAAIASLNALRDYRRAVALGKFVIQRDPKNASIHRELGIALEGIQESRDALEHLDKAIELDPDDLDALTEKAYFLAICADPKCRDGKKARELAIKACLLTKNERPKARLALAVAHAECGEFEQAREIVKELLTKAVPGGTFEPWLKDLQKHFDENKAFHPGEKQAAPGK